MPDVLWPCRLLIALGASLTGCLAELLHGVGLQHPSGRVQLFHHFVPADAFHWQCVMAMSIPDPR